MFGRCDLCGGPGTSGHLCPAMVRNCRLCGGYGLADVTHICPALSRPCQRCGMPGGGETSHICPGPIGYPWIAPVAPVTPAPVTIIWPQVVIVQPTVIIVQPQVIETTYKTVCEARAA